MIKKYWIFKQTCFCPLCGRNAVFHQHRTDSKPILLEAREGSTAIPCWSFNIECCPVTFCATNCQKHPE